MSYQERRTIVSLITTILTTLVYTAYMAERYPVADDYSPELFHYWGSFFLLLIPVSIVSKIVVYILYSIFNTLTTREEEPSVVDERDKLIELKATQSSGYIFIIGVMLAMVSLVMRMPPSIMFVILICSGVVTEIISDIATFFYYRRGL